MQSETSVFLTVKLWETPRVLFMKIKSGWIPGILATALASSCSSAPNSAAAPANGSAAPAKNSRVLWGVNLAGAEFADYQPLPGTYGENYGYPNEVGNAPKGAELGYYASKGLKLVRLPFRWERMQDGLNGPIRESELKQMRAFLEEARQGGFVVIPDCHNYARFYGPGDDKTRKEYVVGVNTDLTALGDLWKKLIPRLSDYGDVIWAWDIMNEPRNMGPGATAKTKAASNCGPMSRKAPSTLSGVWTRKRQFWSRATNTARRIGGRNTATNSKTCPTPRTN